MPFVFQTRMFILRVKDEEYIKSAQAIGVSKLGLIYRHALPNILGKILMQFVRVIPQIIFIQAILAFLGLSPDPNAATLGNLLNDAKSHLDQ
jgi:oligopeptide transport system permease protein